jgi:hypothetical protein
MVVLQRGARFLRVFPLLLLALLVDKGTGLTQPKVEFPYERSEACGTCHKDIYAMWNRAMHANAYNDPIFMSSFLQAFFETKGTATRFCLSCHDPTSAIGPEFDVASDIKGQGVTCDFCHTVIFVILSARSNWTTRKGPSSKSPAG